MLLSDENLLLEGGCWFSYGVRVYFFLCPSLGNDVEELNPKEP